MLNKFINERVYAVAMITRKNTILMRSSMNNILPDVM